MGGGEKIAFLIDKGFGICHKARRSAGVAELVDAPDSKSGEGDLVSVRFRSSVFKEHFKCEVLFFFGFLGIVFATSPFGGQFDAKCSFFWLFRDRFCDVAVWRAVRCEVLFFLAFEGSFL